jgi:glycine cleavage system H protein
LKVNDYEVPEGLYYTKEHEWLKLEGNNCRIGVTDYAQKSLHEIVFVDLPKAAAKVARSQSLGSVESVKEVSDVFAPISGEVKEANAKLNDAPELVNQQPYGDGWIAVIKPFLLDTEIKGLLDAKGYAEFLKTQIK